MYRAGPANPPVLQATDVCAMQVVAGADPGFFLGGGAPPRNGITNTNKPDFFGRIPVVLESRRSSQGGVRTPCTLPLDPPLCREDVTQCCA